MNTAILLLLIKHIGGITATPAAFYPVLEGTPTEYMQLQGTESSKEIEGTPTNYPTIQG